MPCLSDVGTKTKRGRNGNCKGHAERALEQATGKTAPVKACWYQSQQTQAAAVIPQDKTGRTAPTQRLRFHADQGRSAARKKHSGLRCPLCEHHCQEQQWQSKQWSKQTCWRQQTRRRHSFSDYHFILPPGAVHFSLPLFETNKFSTKHFRTLLHPAAHPPIFVQSCNPSSFAPPTCCIVGSHAKSQCTAEASEPLAREASHLPCNVLSPSDSETIDNEFRSPNISVDSIDGSFTESPPGSLNNSALLSDSRLASILHQHSTPPAYTVIAETHSSLRTVLQSCRSLVREMREVLSNATRKPIFTELRISGRSCSVPAVLQYQRP